MYPRTRIPETYPNNPPTHEKLAEMEDDGDRFQVIVGMVGPHDTGTIVAAKDFGPGADLNRLFRLGVIRALRPDELNAIVGGESIPAPTDLDAFPPDAVIEGGDPVVVEEKPSPIVTLPIGVESHPDKVDPVATGLAPIPFEPARVIAKGPAQVPPPPSGSGPDSGPAGESKKSK